MRQDAKKLSNGFGRADLINPVERISIAFTLVNLKECFPSDVYYAMENE